jgi:type IV pilus assembly protein PilM
MDFSLKGLFKSFESLGKKEQSVLGIDIGSSSIKIVQLKKEKERAILETYGEIATGPYADLKIGQAAKLSEDAVVTALKDVLKEANAKAKTAAVAIPLKSSFVITVNLPFSPDKDIAEVIQMEARRYVPVPISEAELDWWVIPEGLEKNVPAEGKRKFTRVLLVAIHKDIISLYKSIISKANLKARAYEIESFSMVRSCLGKESSPVAILDFGASTTKLAVVDYGIIKSSYSINHGSQDLTLALSRSLNIDFNRAEEMKREIGLSDLPENKEVMAVLEPILDYVFTEANRFVKDFHQKYHHSIGKIILTGGGSLLKGLIDFTVKRFTIEVELADPFAKVEYPAFLANSLKGVGMNFSVAIGLALREL